MTEQDLIKFKNLSMQDGRLNLQWFADYVAQAEREECAKVCEHQKRGSLFHDKAVDQCSYAIRARNKE
jgi:hypothetical protein